MANNSSNLQSFADMPSLVEVDELEAVVIVDNEIDCMSWIAPDTVDVTGRFPDLCLNKSVDQEVEGTNVKFLPMESICCGAHGLSVLVVRSFNSTSQTSPASTAYDLGLARQQPRMA